MSRYDPGFRYKNKKTRLSSTLGCFALLLIALGAVYWAGSTYFPPLQTSVAEPVASIEPVIRYPGGVALNERELVKWVIHYTNVAREREGMEPLVYDEQISQIASVHSSNMIRYGYSHELFGKGPTDRALEAGYDCRAYSEDGTSYSIGLSENIARHPKAIKWRMYTSSAWGSKPRHSPMIYPKSDEEMARDYIVSGWLVSPGHRANILDSDARRIGVGIAIEEASRGEYQDETVYATQNFSACD